MYTFGDSILFLGVLFVAAIPAAVAALRFLRPWRPFWRLAAVLAPCMALTGVAALVAYLVPSSAGADSFLGAWSVFSPLRILAAPPFAIAFFLSGLFAPTPASRIASLGAAASKTIVFCWVALIWLASPQ